MYNYDFRDEITKCELLNSLIEIDEKSYYYNLLITNKNILLFDNINKNNTLMASAVSLLPNNLLVLKIPIQNIHYKIEDDSTIIFFDNKTFIIYNFNIKNYI